VLNIGVGNASLEQLSDAKGVQVFSLDPSRRSIDRLQKALGSEDRAKVGYIQNIPFSADTFDAVVMSELIEHLDDETIRQGMAEVARVLRPGGTVVITTPYKENLKENETVCPSCGHVHHKVGHVQSWDEARLRGFIEDANLVVEKMYVTTFVDWERKGIKSRIKSFARILLAWLREPLADPRWVVIVRLPTVAAS